MTIEFWLALALFLSVISNTFLIWFSREQSQQLSYVSQNLGDLVEMIANYREHLRKVYSLEMFYQDETLKALMEHTNALVALLQEEYGEVTYLTDPLEVTIEEESDEEKQENKTKKDVFYGGTRTSNS
tara:strand:+ start:1135 stop:1518 length:384 start_codon:yes stop_codon:yes gene_type:complete